MADETTYDALPIRRVLTIVDVCPYCDSRRIAPDDIGGYNCLACGGWILEDEEGCD